MPRGVAARHYSYRIIRASCEAPEQRVRRAGGRLAGVLVNTWKHLRAGEGWNAIPVCPAPLGLGLRVPTRCCSSAAAFLRCVGVGSRRGQVC